MARALSTQVIGESLGKHLGIEVATPGPVSRPATSPALSRAAMAESLARFVGISDDDRPSEPLAADHDAALSLADRVARGGRLTDAEREMLRTHPKLVVLFSKRLSFERTVLASETNR